LPIRIIFSRTIIKIIFKLNSSCKIMMFEMCIGIVEIIPICGSIDWKIIVFLWFNCSYDTKLISLNIVVQNKLYKSNYFIGNFDYLQYCQTTQTGQKSLDAIFNFWFLILSQGIFVWNYLRHWGTHMLCSTYVYSCTF